MTPEINEIISHSFALCILIHLHRYIGTLIKRHKDKQNFNEQGAFIYDHFVT